MPDYLGPAQIMQQQLHGVLQEAASSAENARATQARRQFEQQKMAKEMEFNYTLAHEFMATNKPLALEHMNAFLKPMGRAVTLDDMDQAKPYFDQANAFREKGDLVGMQMALKGADKYLVNTGDRAKALAMEREAQRGLADQQASVIQNLQQPENPQLQRSRALLDMAGMVGGDLSRIDADERMRLTGKDDLTEQEQAVIKAQAIVEGHDAQRKHYATLFNLDQTAFPQAAHVAAQSIANPEIVAKGRLSQLLMLANPTEEEQRETRGKAYVYGNEQLQKALNIETEESKAETVRRQLEDTQLRQAAMKGHRNAYDLAQQGASSITETVNGLPNVSSPLPDKAAARHILADQVRQTEGFNFYHEDEAGNPQGRMAKEVQSLQQTALEADQQRLALTPQLLRALPARKDFIRSQMQEFDAMAKAHRATANLLSKENPYLIEQKRADLALISDPEKKAIAQENLTKLETARQDDLATVETEKARLDRREIILRGKQPEADRKAEEAQREKLAIRWMVGERPKGRSAQAVLDEAVEAFGVVDKLHLMQTLKAQQGVGIAEAQIEVLTRFGRNPTPSQVAGVAKKYRVEPQDILPGLAEPKGAAGGLDSKDMQQMFTSVVTTAAKISGETGMRFSTDASGVVQFEMGTIKDPKKLAEQMVMLAETQTFLPEVVRTSLLNSAKRLGFVPGATGTPITAPATPASTEQSLRQKLGLNPNANP